MMKTAIMVCMLLFVALSGAAQEFAADGSVRLTNISTDSWRLDQVEGDGITVTGAHQGRVVLAIGHRYHFDLSDIDSEHMPLVIRDIAGRPIFSQENPDQGADWEGSDPEISDDGITFTLTESLAEAISGFRATTYPAMHGFIATYDPEAITEQEAE